MYELNRSKMYLRLVNNTLYVDLQQYSQYATWQHCFSFVQTHHQQSPFDWLKLGILEIVLSSSIKSAGYKIIYKFKKMFFHPPVHAASTKVITPIMSAVFIHKSRAFKH